MLGTWLHNCRRRWNTLFLEGNDGIAEAAVGISAPHGPESLQEGNSVSALAEGKSPQRWVLHERPGDIPIQAVSASFTE